MDIRPLFIPSGMGAPWPLEWGPPVLAVGQGAPSPCGAGCGKSNALSASAKSSSVSQGAAEVYGQCGEGG